MMVQTSRNTKSYVKGGKTSITIVKHNMTLAEKERTKFHSQQPLSFVRQEDPYGCKRFHCLHPQLVLFLSLSCHSSHNHLNYTAFDKSMNYGRGRKKNSICSTISLSIILQLRLDHGHESCLCLFPPIHKTNHNGHSFIDTSLFIWFIYVG